MSSSPSSTTSNAASSTPPPDDCWRQQCTEGTYCYFPTAGTTSTTSTTTAGDTGPSASSSSSGTTAGEVCEDCRFDFDCSQRIRDIVLDAPCPGTYGGPEVEIGEGFVDDEGRCCVDYTGYSYGDKDDYCPTGG